MVTKNDYISLLNSPHLIGEKDIIKLEELQEKFPYSGDIQMLLTKGYHTVDSINYQNQLKNTAISIPNREALYDLIYKVKLKEEITKGEAEVDIPVETISEEEGVFDADEKEKFQVKEEEKEIEGNKSSAIEDIVKQKEKTNDKLEELILSHAIGASYVLEENKEETEKPQQNKVEEEKTKKEKPTKHHSFYSWLTPTENEEEVEEDKKSSIDSLVDKFIKTKENEKIKRKEFFSPTNVAKLSVVESDDFVTETLANIYFKQQMYEKALRAYEKLILKNPEKKTYFASQIKKIKSLLE